MGWVDGYGGDRVDAALLSYTCCTLLSYNCCSLLSYTCCSYISVGLQVAGYMLLKMLLSPKSRCLMINQVNHVLILDTAFMHDPLESSIRCSCVRLASTLCTKGVVPYLFQVLR